MWAPPAPADTTAAQAAVVPAGPNPLTAPPGFVPGPRSQSRSRGGRTARRIVAGLLVLAALVAAGVYFLPDLLLDKGTFTEPAAGNEIQTKAYGAVQRNRIVVSIKEGASAADVDALAGRLQNGKVVGKWENLGLFTIEFAGTTEEELAAALKTAAGAKGIAEALPDRVPKP